MFMYNRRCYHGKFGAKYCEETFARMTCSDLCIKRKGESENHYSIDTVHECPVGTNWSMPPLMWSFVAHLTNTHSNSSFILSMGRVTLYVLEEEVFLLNAISTDVHPEHNKYLRHPQDWNCARATLEKQETCSDICCLMQIMYGEDTFSRIPDGRWFNIRF